MDIQAALKETRDKLKDASNRLKLAPVDDATDATENLLKAVSLLTRVVEDLAAKISQK
jgi:hypothetical protein